MSGTDEAYVPAGVQGGDVARAADASSAACARPSQPSVAARSVKSGGAPAAACRAFGRGAAGAVWVAACVTAAACAPGRAGSRAPAAAPAAEAADGSPLGGAANASAAECCAAAGRRVAAGYRAAALGTSHVTHRQLWAALDPHLRGPDLRVRDLGRSVEGRPIRAITFGHGRTRVLLWSQMHGDEPTATLALADVVAWLADPRSRRDAARARLAAELTVVLVPMLNPDGAERRRRENAAGVDVNRDARRLASPEARTLRALYDTLRPAFAFNLHDQRARAAGRLGGPPVALALLAPAAGPDGAYGPARANARLVAAGMAALLETELPRRVAKYDERYEPRAFGEFMQGAGTSTVLLETGTLPGDPGKHRLRALNVAALVAALDGIATGRFRHADPRAYDALPRNASVPPGRRARGG